MTPYRASVEVEDGENWLVVSEGLTLVQACEQVLYHERCGVKARIGSVDGGWERDDPRLLAVTDRVLEDALR